MLFEETFSIFLCTISTSAKLGFRLIFALKELSPHKKYAHLLKRWSHPQSSVFVPVLQTDPHSRQTPPTGGGWQLYICSDVETLLVTQTGAGTVSRLMVIATGTGVLVCVNQLC